MSKLVSFESEYGEIIIESDERGVTRSGGENRSAKKFEEAISIIETIGNAIVSKVKAIKESPDEVSIEVGLKFSVEAGAIIAKTSTEGSIVLTLNWKNDK